MNLCEKCFIRLGEVRVPVLREMRARFYDRNEEFPVNVVVRGYPIASDIDVDYEWRCEVCR